MEKSQGVSEEDPKRGRGLRRQVGRSGGGMTKEERCELWLLGNLTAPPVFVRNLKTLYSPGMAMAADDRVQIVRVYVYVSGNNFERVPASR